MLGRTGVSESVAFAREAEELGFGTFWVAEDYYYGGSFAIATAVAAATQRIRVGIGVINPFTRHPALIAMEAGALDALSGGRLILGLGASNVRWIERDMGIPFVRPLGATREAVDIVRRLMARERVTYDGKSFRLHEVELSFAPFRADLPIWLGAKGPQALRASGAIADGVLLSVLSSAAYIRWARARIADGAREAGRDERDVAVGAYVLVHADKDRERARAVVRPVVAHYMGIHYDHVIMREAGFPPEQTLVFRRALLEGHDASSSVTEEMLDSLAVVGTPDECRERLGALAEAGLTQPVCFQVASVSLSRTMAFVRDHLAR